MSFLGPIVGGQMAANKSFVGPDPNTGREDQKVMMSPEMFKSTFDEDFQRDNNAYAAMHKYRHRFQPETQMGYRLGSDYARPAFGKLKNGLGGFFSMGPVDAGVVGGLGGAALGGLGGMGWNMFSDRKVDPKILAMLGALMGVTVGGTGGYLHRKGNTTGFAPMKRPRTIPRDEYLAQVNQIMGKHASVKQAVVEQRGNKWVLLTKDKKRILGTHDSAEKAYKQEYAIQKSEERRAKKASFWRDGEGGSGYRQLIDDRNWIIGILNSVPGMSFNEKAHLMSGVQRLDQQGAAALKRMLGMTGGAAAGAMIARFLIGKGLVSTLLGAVTGGVIGSALFGKRTPQPTTFGGQPLGAFL